MRRSVDVDGWWRELEMLDSAGYAAIAATPTPVLGGRVRHRGRHCLPRGRKRRTVARLAGPSCRDEPAFVATGPVGR